jgi:sarcosine oxidase
MIHADVIVVGLGAAGSATLLQLARRGASVIGIDRFSPPHARGSSHGETRITRLALGEGEAYTPLVVRSHAIWREIEAETGARLMTQCGGLVIQGGGVDAGLHGAADFLAATVACARRYGIAHDILAAADIAERFPQFTLRGDEHGYFEPSAGFVRPEACIAAQLQLAERHGAVLHRDERVVDISGEGARVRVRTDHGAYVAQRCVISAGRWIGDFVPPPQRRWFAVYPQTIAWFALRDGARDHSPEAMPVYICAGVRGVLYGFPAVDGPGGGVKVGSEQFQRTAADDGYDDVTQEDVHDLYLHHVRGRLGGLSERCLRAMRCAYTTTPDHAFVVDDHPDDDRVLLLSACSGHGFKHSAGLGDAIAELLTSGKSPVDLSRFTLARFAGARA